jgi:hypothetical protein
MPQQKLNMLYGTSLLKKKLPPGQISKVGEYLTGNKGSIEKQAKKYLNKGGRRYKTKHRRIMKKRKTSKKSRRN